MSGTQPDGGDDGLVTLAEAAEQLGVHYMTAYRYVRTGRMSAEKRGGKWWVTPAALAEVIAEGTGARRSTSRDGSGVVSDGMGSGRPRERLVEPFTRRLIDGDTVACWAIITDALAGGATPVEIHRDFLQVALERVGSAWEQGEITVADEHRATATASRLIGQLGPLFRRRGRNRGTIVVGAVAGDPHALPSAILTDLLTDRRFAVVDLGANTPAASFVDAARGLDDLVGIGMCAVLDDLVHDAFRQVGFVRSAMPDTLLVAGGPAMVAAAERLGPIVDLVSRTADEACAAFEQAVDEARLVPGERGA